MSETKKQDEKRTPRRFPCDVVPLVMCPSCGWKRPATSKACPMCPAGDR